MIGTSNGKEIRYMFIVDITTWKKAWSLLDDQEKRSSSIVLVIIIIGALSSASMVGSVMPFLAVLSEPSLIETNPAFNWAYDAFGFTSAYGFLVGLGLASFGVIVLSSVIQIVRTWAVAHFTMMRVHSISQRLLATYLAQKYAFFLNRHSGDMGPRILTEADQVVHQFFRPAAELVAAILTTSAILGLLLWVDLLVALISILILGGIYGVIYKGTKHSLKQFGQVILQVNRQRFRIVNESISGIKDIKLLGREMAYIDRYETPSMQMAKTQSKVVVLSLAPQFSLQAISLGGIILLCIIFIDRDGIASGESLGGFLPTLGVFAFAGQRLMPELSKIYQSLAQMQAGVASVDAVHEDLALRKTAAALPRSPGKALGMKQKLELNDLSYSYPNSENAGVRNISVTIRAGEKVGIVGSTGAGKTTLADVVLGLLEPDSGCLVVDGVSITPENLRSWTRSVAYVAQDIFLTDAPVAENIATMGLLPHEIDLERVKKAASIAKIAQFVEEDLSEGYKTHVGERGMRLSGGQKQRIGIARAMYHEADLIVFDEATSALDNLTEAEVMDAIDALPGEKTVLMIAHRLSTVKSCNRIIVLDKGRIVGCDTWDDLMAKNKVFQKLARVRENA